MIGGMTPTRNMCVATTSSLVKNAVPFAANPRPVDAMYAMKLKISY